MNFTGPIVPTIAACEHQALGWGSFLQVVQTLLNFSVYIAVFFAVLIFAYAGFLLVTNPANSGNIDTAKEVIKNALIGLIIVLGAWLIVNTVLSGLGAGSLASLSSTLFTGNPCAETFYSVAPTDNGGLTAGNDCPGGLICTGGKCTPDPELDNEGDGSAGSLCKSGLANCIAPLVCDATDTCSDPNNPPPAPPTSCTTGGIPAPSGGGGSCTPIPDSGLVTIDSAGHQLIPDAASRFAAMKRAAAAAGINLVVTSAYRSPDQQTQAWNNNGCNLVNGKAVCATRTAAVPCSLGGNGSNHTRGTAVDITLSSGVYAWLKANGGSYGFYNNLPNDLPHFSDTGR